MLFHHPQLLWSLGVVIIPLLIHLFNFQRHQERYFSNVKLLKEIVVETRKQSKIKQLLILLLRIATFILIVLAFAQPYLPVSKKNSSESERVSIYLDNSYSMEANQQSLRPLTSAKEVVKTIAKSYPENTIFQLLTNEFHGSQQRQITKKELLTKLDEVTLVPTTRSLTEISKRQLDAVGNHPHISWIISDMQKSTLGFGNFYPDTLQSCYLLPISNPKIKNISIDSCWLSSPMAQAGQKMELKVLLRNDAETTLEHIPVKLTINGKQCAMAATPIPANATTLVTLSFTCSNHGEQMGIVSIEDHPVSFDDDYYFSFIIPEKLTISIIGEKENPNFSTLFGLDSSFNVHFFYPNNINLSILKTSNTIILDGITSPSSGLISQLSSFVEKGGSLVIFPAENLDDQKYNILLAKLHAGSIKKMDTSSMRVTSISRASTLFDDVFISVPKALDLPRVNQHYPLVSSTTTTEEQIISFANNTAFLKSVKEGIGTVWLFAIPTGKESSNLMHHPIFLPLMYRIVLLSLPKSTHHLLCQQDNPLLINHELPNPTAIPQLVSNDEQRTIIPIIRQVNDMLQLSFHQTTLLPGNYRIIAGDTLIGVVGVNIHRSESMLDCFTTKELETHINESTLTNCHIVTQQGQELSSTISTIHTSKELYRYFILAGLLMLVAETVLLRFWKRRV